MNRIRTFRPLTLTALLAAAAVCASSGAFAQRGMGGPGGIPKGPGGAMGPLGAGGMDRAVGGRGGERGERNPQDGFAPRIAPTLGPPGRWWDDRKIARNLSLRDDQLRRMDGIFEAGKGNLVQLYSNLQHEEARLSTMSNADLSDETKVFAAIDRVTQARADVAKANAHILLQIRKEMDASQLAALERETASLR